MTEIKKTTARKTTAKPADSTEAEVKVEKRILKETDEVTVMNNTTGRYGYRSPNGFVFDLDKYGQTIDVPLKELRVMASGKSRTHLTSAWIIILDEDAVKALNLTNLYNHIYTEEQVFELLKKPEHLPDVFVKMPEAMQLTVLQTAKRLVNSGKLRDLRVVQIIKDLVDVDILE